jgi:hypothetical protein
MDHDRLFKELLTTFFYEFVELLLPEVSAYLEAGSVVFLDKEVFTDVTAGARYLAGGCFAISRVCTSYTACPSIRW